MGMVNCPQDLNQFISGAPIFENTFPEEECEQKRFYGDCFHCFTTAIAKRDKQLKQKVQSEYENRLKADMVAMLEDLKQDFIAEAYGIEMDCTDYVVNVADIDKIIQQKITRLRED